MSSHRLIARLPALLLPGLLALASAAVAQLPDFTPLVKQNAPAVVNISTVQKAQPRVHGPRGRGDLDEFFRRFFPPDGGGR